MTSKRQQHAEQRWLATYRSPERISGKYIFPIPPYIYAGVGGFKGLDTKHKAWRAAA